MIESPVVTEDGTEQHCPRHSATALHYLPLAPDIPLVLAARLSLSFPGLISAVPLYSHDYTRTEHNRGIVPVWFSDGGIGSNFPMRFFDMPWPTRPTFGINLTPVDPDRPSEMVWRAPVGKPGSMPHYSPITGLGGFLGAIFDTLQNWHDSTQIIMPGYRDRVVNIRQNANEGGMNLQMPEKVITSLAERGGMAATNLLHGDEATGTPPFNFDVHRWIRYRGAMAGLDDMLTVLRETNDAIDEQGFIAGYEAPPDVPRYPPGDAQNDRDATAAVLKLAEDLADLRNPAVPNAPRPLADMRLIPPI
jgi:Patatin-like phospholipase